MKRLLLFSLAGGLTLFFWQFLSFAALNFHGSAQEYTPLDQEILAHLAQLNLDEGMYALGSPSPEERADPDGLGAEYMARMEGQPYAVLNYQYEWSSNMLPNLLRSLVMNVLTALLLFWLLGQISNPTLGKRLGIALAVGFIGFMFYPYSNFIWHKTPDIWAHLADSVVPFALIGLLSSRFLDR
jgi:hypothetical protein